MKKIWLKILCLVMTAAAAVISVSGCSGSAAYRKSDTGTVFICKNGRVVTSDIESFDTSLYSLLELKSFVKSSLSDFRSDYGRGSVKLTSLSEEEGAARLVLTYDSDESYAAFYDTELFTGRVLDALRAGYDFDVSFKDAQGRQHSVSEVLDSEKLSVVIIKTDSAVTVPGTIVYYSYDTNGLLTAPDTLFIGAYAASREDEEPAEGEEGEEGEDAQDAKASGSVSDDELLTGEEQEEEVIFDFDAYEEEHPSLSSDKDTYSDRYTYIIYE